MSGRKMGRIDATCDAEMQAAVARIAAARGVSAPTVIRWAVKAYVDNEEANEKEEGKR